jgi:heme exporter protein C
MTATDPDPRTPEPGRPPAGPFVAHALGAMALLAALNWLATTYVPFAVEGIGSSYLIMYYHVPSAIVTTLLYGFVCLVSILFLVTRNRLWDRLARAYVAAGLLANAVTLLTGSVWAKAAWNHWWDWRDPRLTSVAIMFLMYVGYVALNASVDDEEKRPRYAAVYGILAAVNIPIVKKAIEWFGMASHPQKVGTGPEITATWTFGILAFLAFYTAIAQWKLHRDGVRERVEAALGRVRRIEEASA